MNNRGKSTCLETDRGVEVPLPSPPRVGCEVEVLSWPLAIDATGEGIDDGTPLKVFCDRCDEPVDGSDRMSAGRLVLLLASEGFGFARLREREPIMAPKMEEGA